MIGREDVVDCWQALNISARETIYVKSSYGFSSLPYSLPFWAWACISGYAMGKPVAGGSSSHFVKRRNEQYCLCLAGRRDSASLRGDKG